ncbi:AraC family transcriptional regulator [Sporanaerobium hydrogeniformans]|uniref:AraC family transcriptional regulator n=1 Tax=Sporanaerobium hydrogeniformans TaxID=3072179 RepID=A0AC61DA82_9FIRM|nr:PocR ligand-binding domain-containing protein [Sporanaerobium hydrogeniformans]PHV69668.1 AraC family transcriptional regulator [Sporanaerobium hydrogeniformans]
MKPYLYTIVEKKKLREMLEAFEACLNLPIQVIDEHGDILEACGNTTPFCSIVKGFLPKNDSCEKIHIAASKKAIELGETYIFSCHANLNHIVFPLLNKGVFFASILVGPFLMDKPDSLLIADVAHRYAIGTDDLLELYDTSYSIRVIAPALVTHISKLLYFLFYNLISDSQKQFMDNQDKFHQQSKINESIQMYKTFDITNKTSYPYEKEKELISKVKVGNIQEAKSILNDLLGYVLFSEGNSLDILKTRAVELCSLLSRAAIEGGGATDTILKISNQFLKSLQEITDFEILCSKLQEAVEVFVESSFNYTPTKSNDRVKKAVAYISKNFSHAISLEEVAEHVNLNPTYFSSIFKQYSGSSFREYLNMVRIEESKRLLSNTDYTIIDIAIAVGFEDQSYFSKVFKKYTGLTPKQYR